MRILTIKDYQSAVEVDKEYLPSDFRNENPVSENTPAPFQSYCKHKIAELEKPAPKQYRCIKNSFPFNYWTVGEVKWESTGAVEYSEHPFHFEEVIPEPIAAPVTIQDIFDCLESESTFISNSNSLSKLFRQAINEGSVEV